MNRILVSIIIAGALIVSAVLLKPEAPNMSVAPLGGFAQVEALNSTTTGVVANFPDGRVIQSPVGKARQGVSNTTVSTGTPTFLGSVIITTTGTSPFCLYDATSTVPNAEWATTTIACFPASAVVGEYPFNIEVQKGILFDPSGSITTTTFASTTFTFK